MNEIDVLRHGFAEMHGLLDRATGEMTLEQWNFLPAEGGVSPFFSLWHYVRTEDNIVSYVIRGRQTAWLAGGYDTRLGLPRTAQGTGMSKAEADAVRLADLDAWRDYQAATWRETAAWLDEIDPAAFGAARVTIRPVGEMSLWQAAWSMCLAHGYRHVGEIEYARGLLGLGGLTI